MNGIIKTKLILKAIVVASSFIALNVNAKNITLNPVEENSAVTPMSATELPEISKVEDKESMVAKTGANLELAADKGASEKRTKQNKSPTTAKGLPKGIYFNDIDYIPGYAANHIDSKHFQSKQVSPLSADVFGDTINPLTGELSIRVTDISIPGNSHLPVEITRRKDDIHANGTDDPNYKGPNVPNIGPFTLELPHLTTRVFRPNYMPTLGVYDGNNYVTGQKLGWPKDRCSNLLLKTFKTSSNLRYAESGLEQIRPVDLEHHAGDFFQGVTLNVTGNWGEQLMYPMDDIDYGSVSPSYVTKSNWKFECMDNSASDGGQGFRGIAPNGDVYEFKELYYTETSAVAPDFRAVDEAGYTGLGKGPTFQAVLFATKVTDVHGNTVQYDYVDGKLDSIYASDGRRIDVTYNSSEVTITAHGKTWRYKPEGDGYSVYLPSEANAERKWIYKMYSGDLLTAYGYEPSTFGDEDTGMIVFEGPCSTLGGDYSLAEITHPSGMTATFTPRKKGTNSPFGEVEKRILTTTMSAMTHKKFSSDDKLCDGILPKTSSSDRPYASVKYSVPVGKKVVTGPGLSPMTWYYGYEEGEVIKNSVGREVVEDTSPEDPNASKVPVGNRVKRFTNDLAKPTTRRSIIDPDGNLTVLHVNRQHNALYGQVEQVDYYGRSDIAAPYNDSESYTIQTNGALYNYGFSQKTIKNHYGVSTRLGEHWLYHDIGTRPGLWPRPSINIDTSQHKPLLFHREIIQGATYNTVYAYDDDPISSTYSYQLPTKIQRYSNLSYKLECGGCNSEESMVQEEETTYKHLKDKWVIGLIEKVNIGTLSNKSTTLKNVYKNNSPLIDKVYKFDKLVQTNNEYHSDGNLKKVTYNATPARVLTYTDYKNGIARKVEQPGTAENPISYLHTAVDDFGQITKITDFTTQTDINSVIEGCTTFDYDFAFRLSLINPCDFAEAGNEPDKHSNLASTTISYSKGSSSLGYALKKSTTKGDFRAEVLYDAMLRPIQSKTWDATSSTPAVYINSEYNSNGLVTFKSRPSHISNSTNGISSTYNGVGELTKTTDSETNLETIYYIYGSSSQVIHPNGSTTVSYYLGLGSPARDVLIFSTTYNSEGWGLTSIEVEEFTHLLQPQIISHDPAGYDYDETDTVLSPKITEYRSYDGPNLCKTSRNEIGTKWYGHNALGDVTWAELGGDYTTEHGCKSAASSGNSIDFTYDERGNVSQIDYPDDTPDKVYKYNQNNMVTQVSLGDVTRNFDYRDELLTEEKITIDDKALALSYLYDKHKNVKRVTYPSGEKVYFDYNSMGQAITAGFFAYDAVYHPNGALKSHYYGNGVQFEVTLNSKGLSERQTESSDGLGMIVDTAQTYDVHNNLKTLTDYVDQRYNLSLRYDGADRLRYIDDSFNGTGEIKYDSIGNIVQKRIGNQTIDYHYNANNQLDYVSNGYAKDYDYDEHGNVTSDGSFTFTYNLGGQMVKAYNSSTTNDYLYDEAGKRVKVASSQAGDSYSMYGQGGKLMYRFTKGKHIDYIYLGNKLVSRLESLAEGSASLSSGNGVERMHYKPFGETIEAPKDEAGYTGHKFDTDLGLSYMQARYYDPVIGRFYSNDPVGFTGEIDTFNRYSYVANNPFKYTDPNGEEKIIVGVGVDAMLIAGVRAGFSVSFDTENLELGGGYNVGPRLGVGLGVGGSFGISQSENEPAKSESTHDIAVSADATVAHKSYGGDIMSEKVIKDEITTQLSQGDGGTGGKSDKPSKGKLGLSASIGVEFRGEQTTDVIAKSYEYVKNLFE
ncbi:hypothetical protein C2869_06840 [Saccharobesus litoralis]|uniref:RHS repeat-associated core domain-containing protein n=1 Tax=Saccharobesus litoralis TaxID=2172099 RepID=A0A2S0VPP3_9ALTE|nr:RHS repeat-associated core domain-containing protein [Saccharobesus litoralis]AWB66169.1 hypothetical protein C2869_06840 [Saccharobesus litoralis]